MLPLVDQIAAVNTPEPARSNVILPTGFGRHTHEGRWWARPPQRAESLPLLSEVVEAVVTIL